LPHVKVYMGVGATIDYEAQAVRRAPRWMTQNGLEWVYRMTTEPRRYWRRYARTMEFFGLVLLDRLGLYRPPARLGETIVRTSEARIA
jgi:UDP-N-acetyl-D-mannosaminuronic acid transferase (WecB/TagA/CpsF family)